MKTIYLMNSMSKSSLFSLPFLKSYHSQRLKFIRISKAQTFFGFNFYPRLNSIYINLVEALAKKNYRYINSSLQSSLANKMLDEMKSLDEGRYKLKIHLPKAKISTVKPKKYQKYFDMRDRVWKNGVTRIGVQCRVFFGHKFDPEKPLFDKQLIYRIGQFRYLIYDPNRSFLENIRNCYDLQTYEFNIQYSSKMFLQVYSFDQSPSPSSSEKDEEVMSEITMRAGSEKFDWIITDINGLSNRQDL